MPSETRDWGSDKSDDAFDISVGRAISVIRCSIKMSVVQLAKGSIIEVHRMNRIERGATSVYATELLAISNVLGSNAGTLIAVAEQLRVSWRCSRTPR